MKVSYFYGLNLKQANFENEIILRGREYNAGSKKKKKRKNLIRSLLPSSLTPA